MINSDLKIDVLFFSPTGNCERIAKSIAAYFKDDVRLSNIALSEPIALQNIDILFLVVPVYGQLCPAFIMKILKELQYKGTVVPCVSYGSVCAGKALKQICTILQKNGAKILAGAEFASSHCYYPSIGLDTLLLKENIAINELCSKVVSRFSQKDYSAKINVQHFNPLSLLMPTLRVKLGTKLVRKDDSVCLKCKICKANCPFNAIKTNLKENVKCQRCSACVKLCKNNNKQIVLHPIMRKYLEKYIDYSKNSKIY